MGKLVSRTFFTEAEPFLQKRTQYIQLTIFVHQARSDNRGALFTSAAALVPKPKQLSATSLSSV